MSDEVSHPIDPKKVPDWEVLARYLEGESPAEEKARVDQWMAAHPVDKELLEQINVHAQLEPAADVDVEAALRKVQGRFNQAPVSAAAERTRLRLERGGGAASGPPRSVLIGVALAAAAAIIAFVTLKPGSSPKTPAAAAKVYATGTGKRDSIRLADGSRVVLGPESRLTVPGDYGTAARAVSLEGDAYFDVTHDAQKPFSVKTGTALVEDVGTTFTVESDPDETTTVSVMSGVVRLRAATDAAAGGTVLNAGDRGVLQSNGQVHAQKQTVVADDSAWTTGKLVFRDAQLSRVAGELRRWYGIRLGIADSALKSRTVNTQFESAQPIDDVLKILSMTLGASFERQGDTATIHAGRGSYKVK
jgi:transmembrane sensor